MSEKKGSWHLLTGLLLGLLVGVVLSLWVIPVQYVNADPSSLREKDKQVYRIMVAQAYLVEGDVNRALARLALIHEENTSEKIIAQAQSLLAEGGSESQARALALLGAAVNEPALSITPLPPLTPAAVLVTEPPVEGTEHTGSSTEMVETRTPGPSSTPRPTATLMATAGPPFALQGEAQEVCDPLPEKPLLQVTVLDASDQPVAGVKIEISTTAGGVETFFTGLYPEISRGYADYEMLPGVAYAIRVGDSGQPISNLTAPSCEGGVYGSLELVFKQP